LFTEDGLKLGDILEYCDKLAHDGSNHLRVLLVWLQLEVGNIGKRDGRKEWVQEADLG
jgi:hypothetical protein